MLITGHLSYVGHGHRNPFLSSNTQSAEVGPSGLKGREEIKKEVRNLNFADYSVESPPSSLWE